MPDEVTTFIDMASQRMPKAVLRPLQLSSSQSAVPLPRHIVSTLLPQVAQLRWLAALLGTFHSIQPHIRSVLERCGQESAQSTIRQARRQESVSDLSGRLGMASAGDALKDRQAQCCLEVPGGTWVCLAVSTAA